MTHDWNARRREMVRRQLASRGIKSDRVLAALERVPRERFVPEDAQALAYEDRALSIDCGQTISQPYIVALMTEALELTGAERVLEVGTGSGYQTAVLAELAAEVVSLERHAELSATAAARLAALKIEPIRLVVGNGRDGWPPAAPYDRILVTAGAAALPRPLWEQLADGGVLVAPLGPHGDQHVVQIRKSGQREIRTPLCPCRFVPLL